MCVTGAVAVEGESGQDRRIYVRVSSMKKIYWYVIEEKSQREPSANEMPECDSERDRVRRLLLPDAGLHTNNHAVINSLVYLIGGDSHTHTHNSDDDESLGYRYLDLDLDLGVVREWRTGGGKSTDDQFGGGVTVGHNGSVYSVGPTLYRLRSGVGKWDKLPIPQGPNPLPNGFLYDARLLGITENKLYLYRVGGGVNGDANVMLSFDLESGKWDDDVLDDNFWGNWSPGVVLYKDRYLFSLGTMSPKRKPKPAPEEEFEEPRRMTRRVLVEVLEEEEEEVPGIYVFDLQQREWLAEPVQGLPNDGSVIPVPYQPYPDFKRFSPQLFQIRNDNENHLALLWDSFSRLKCKLIWCKFILDVSPDTTTDVSTDTSSDDFRSFYAHSLSRGFCPLDEKTSFILSCAVGMQARVAAA
ncbi:hypothetical protein ACLB2K_009027 [Fragaria x ananassa]